MSKDLLLMMMNKFRTFSTLKFVQKVCIHLYNIIKFQAQSYLLKSLTFLKCLLNVLTRRLLDASKTDRASPAARHGRVKITLRNGTRLTLRRLGLSL